MIRNFLFLAIIGSMCLMNLAVDFNDEEIKQNIVFTVLTNENKELFDQDHIIEEFTSQKQVDGVLHYVLGARKASDRLVASGGQNQSWSQPRNVKIALSYPPQGTGAQVTYVAIVVNQTSSLGQAYVLKGGINQRFITIVVEAYNTMVFNVFAYIYGV